MQVLSCFQALFNTVCGLVQRFAPGLLPHPGSFRERPPYRADAVSSPSQGTGTASVLGFTSPKDHDIESSCSSKSWDAMKRLCFRTVSWLCSCDLLVDPSPLCSWCRRLLPAIMNSCRDPGRRNYSSVSTTLHPRHPSGAQATRALSLRWSLSQLCQIAPGCLIKPTAPSLR